MGMPAITIDSPPRRRWTTAQVRDLMDESRAWPRYELIDGELIVTPSASYPHQIAVTEIWRAIEGYALAQRVGQAVTSPADLELQPGTITQPDVFVLPAAAFPDTDDTHRPGPTLLACSSPSRSFHRAVSESIASSSAISIFKRELLNTG